MHPALLSAIIGGGAGLFSNLFGGDDEFELGNINDLSKYGIRVYDAGAAKNDLYRSGQNQIKRNRANKYAYMMSKGIAPESVSAFSDDEAIYNAIMGQHAGIDQYANDDQYRRLNALMGIKQAEYNNPGSSIFDDILGGVGMGLNFGDIFSKIKSPGRYGAYRADN